MQPALFSVHTPSFAHPSPAYAGIEHIMHGHADFEAIGSPFVRMQHPLLLETRADPKARLASSWDILGMFRDDTLVPALYRSKIVLADGFGLDAYIAAASAAPLSRQRELAEYHHDMVSVHLKDPGLPTPRYIIIDMAPAAEADYLIETDQRFKEFARSAIEDFIAKKAEIIAGYFSPAYGQLEPIRLDYGEMVSNEALCQRAVCLMTGNAAIDRLAA